VTWNSVNKGVFVHWTFGAERESNHQARRHLRIPSESAVV